MTGPRAKGQTVSGNTFGSLFAVTNFGESHGPAIGCVIDGCPPGLVLSEADIQPELDRRRPGTSRHVTQRQESDQVQILSGVFEGRTTGTPANLSLCKCIKKEINIFYFLWILHACTMHVCMYVCVFVCMYV